MARMETKTCNKCQQAKPLDVFPLNPPSRRKTVDGREPVCKQCVNERIKRYRLTPKGAEVAREVARKHRATAEFKAHRRERDKARYWTDAEHRAKIIAINKEFAATEAGRQTRKRATQKYKASNRTKIAARSAVNHAIAAGRLPEPESLPCAECGCQAVEYHHHHGYDPAQWLDVQAVCKACHYSLDNMAPASIA